MRGPRRRGARRAQVEDDHDARLTAAHGKVATNTSSTAAPGAQGRARGEGGWRRRAARTSRCTPRATTGRTVWPFSRCPSMCSRAAIRTPPVRRSPTSRAQGAARLSGSTPAPVAHRGRRRLPRARGRRPPRPPRARAGVAGAQRRRPAGGGGPGSRDVRAEEGKRGVVVAGWTPAASRRRGCARACCSPSAGRSAATPRHQAARRDAAHRQKQAIELLVENDGSASARTRCAHPRPRLPAGAGKASREAPLRYDGVRARRAFVATSTALLDAIAKANGRRRRASPRGRRASARCAQESQQGGGTSAGVAGGRGRAFFNSAVRGSPPSTTRWATSSPRLVEARTSRRRSSRAGARRRGGRTPPPPPPPRQRPRRATVFAPPPATASVDVASAAAQPPPSARRRARAEAPVEMILERAGGGRARARRRPVDAALTLLLSGEAPPPPPAAGAGAVTTATSAVVAGRQGDAAKPDEATPRPFIRRLSRRGRSRASVPTALRRSAAARRPMGFTGGRRRLAHTNAASTRRRAAAVGPPAPRPCRRPRPRRRRRRRPRPR